MGFAVAMAAASSSSSISRATELPTVEGEAKLDGLRSKRSPRSLVYSSIFCDSRVVGG